MFGSFALSCTCTVILLFNEIRSETWNLVWSDEFNTGSSPDTTKWDTYRTTWESSKQLQLYVDSNSYIENGNLVIKTVYDPITYYDPYYEKNRDFDYKSGVIVSKDYFEFTYGKIEIRAKLPDPSYTRLHLAFWLLSKSSAACYQEYDIMEQWTGRGFYNVDNRVTSAYHFNYNNKAGCSDGIDPTKIMEYPYSSHSSSSANGPWLPSGGIDCSQSSPPYYCGTRNWNDAYSIWRVEWETDSVTLYIDDVKVGYIDSNDGTMPYQPMHIIINTAVCNQSWCNNYGDLITDSTKTAELKVDYVRVYEKVSSAHHGIINHIINDDNNNNIIYNNQKKEIKSLSYIITICCAIIVSLLIIISISWTIFCLKAKRYSSIKMIQDTDSSTN